MSATIDRELKLYLAASKFKHVQAKHRMTWFRAIHSIQNDDFVFDIDEAMVELSITLIEWYQQGGYQKLKDAGIKEE
jgi:hypothetical protein